GMCAVPGAYGQDASRVFTFDIGRQPLSESLRAFSNVAGQQIIFSEDIVRGLQAPELHGSYTIDQALKALLANTKLIIERTKAGIIMVRAPSVGSRDRRAESHTGLPSSLDATAAGRGQTSLPEDETERGSAAAGGGNDRFGLSDSIEEVVVTGTL